MMRLLSEVGLTIRTDDLRLCAVCFIGQPYWHGGDLNSRDVPCLCVECFIPFNSAPEYRLWSDAIISRQYGLAEFLYLEYVRHAADEFNHD